MGNLLEFEHFSQVLGGKTFIIMPANQSRLKKKKLDKKLFIWRKVSPSEVNSALSWQY